MPDHPTVGFIGLGIMGAPMARNLLAAGFPLVVHNRSRGRVDELVAEGAQPGNSPRDVAERAQVVITMLPDSPDVEAVYLEPDDGVLAGVSKGTLLIDMSTIGPDVARAVAAAAADRGAEMLDAPVSGGDAGACAGTLSIMVGGPAQALQRARQVLEALGTTIVHVGDSGSGQVVKACNQVVVALTIEAVSEALVLGSKAGVDPAKIIEVLSGGLAANRVMEMKGHKLLEHDLAPGFKLELHHKDLGIALAAGRQFGVPLPSTAVVDQHLLELRQRGYGGLDHCALILVIEERAQHRIGREPTGAELMR